MHHPIDPLVRPPFIQPGLSDPILLSKLESLKVTPNLTLNDHVSDDRTCAEIAQYMKFNDIITNLEATGGNITGNGLALLSEPIAHSRVLLSINFSRNKISDADPGLPTFFVGLMSNPIIQNIDLSYNFLGKNSALLISDLIRKSLSLRSINLRNNNFDTESANILLSAVEGNKTLQFLYLENNNCDPVILVEIDKILSINRHNPIPNILPPGFPPPQIDHHPLIPPPIGINRIIPPNSILNDPYVINPRISHPRIPILSPRHPIPPPPPPIKKFDIEADYIIKYNTVLNDFKHLEAEHIDLCKTFDEYKIKSDISEKGYIHAVEAEKHKNLDYEMEIKRLNDLLFEKDHLLASRLAEQKGFLDSEIIKRDEIIRKLTADFEMLKLSLAEIEAANNKLKANIIALEERLVVEHKKYEDLNFLLVEEKKLRAELEVKFHADISSAEKEIALLRSDLNIINIDAANKIKNAEAIIANLELKIKEYHIELAKLDSLYKEEFEKARRLALELEKFPLFLQENAVLKKEIHDLHYDNKSLALRNNELKVRITESDAGNLNKEAEIGMLRNELEKTNMNAEHDLHKLSKTIVALEDGIRNERDRAEYYEKRAYPKYIAEVRPQVVPIDPLAPVLAHSPISHSPHYPRLLEP